MKGGSAGVVDGVREACRGWAAIMCCVVAYEDCGELIDGIVAITVCCLGKPAQIDRIRVLRKAHENIDWSVSIFACMGPKPEVARF